MWSFLDGHKRSSDKIRGCPFLPTSSVQGQLGTSGREGMHVSQVGQKRSFGSDCPHTFL